jgi:hypothetical protein
MSRRNVTLVLCAAAVLLAAGGLYASNMGFKLNYPLAFTGTSNGTNTLSLPWNPQIGITNADQLLDDMNSTSSPTGQVASIQKFQVTNNSFTSYTKGVADPPGGFTIDKGVGLHVRVNGNTNYVVVGSDDPAFVHTFIGGGASANGTNLYSHVYHATAINADQLLDEMNATGTPTGQITSIQQWIKSNNSLTSYTKGVADPPGGFSLVPGEAYRIKLSGVSNVTYVPSHY